jgi:hypothetical protein
MTEPLNRDEIIALLEQLGGEDDANVLAAARALHAAVADAGTTWAELLIPEDGGDSETADMDAEADDSAEAEAETPADAAGRDAEALALIDKLLARPGVTETFRDEMAGYKRDIADGAFENADHRYLVALQKRLAGKG